MPLAWVTAGRGEVSTCRWKTSRRLYRRWPRKDDLVLDAIQHYGATHLVEIPDTGSLRGDMIAVSMTASPASALLNAP
jgi:hypothetical protein